MELLPQEITIDILSRLTADSVLLCKRVCRAWEALIEEPGFHDKWMHRFDPAASKNRLGTIQCVFYEPEVKNDSYPLIKQLQFGVYSSDEAGMGSFELRDTPADHHPPFNFKGSYSWTIVGSCNGLICLTTRAGELERKPFNCHKYSMYVGNPLTREYVEIPRIKIKTQSHCTSVGFGYCPTTEEYKVIVIYDWNVEVYTLGSGRWRNKRTKFLKYWSSQKCSRPWTAQNCSKPGVLVNGALYFYRGVDGHIVSFDLAKEQFRIVQSPAHHRPPDQTERVQEDFKLGVLGGSLTLFKVTQLLFNDTDVYDAWVMDNEQESWTKKFSKEYNNREEVMIGDDNSPDVWFHNNFMFSYVKSFISVKDLGEKDAILM